MSVLMLALMAAAQTPQQVAHAYLACIRSEARRRYFSGQSPEAVADGTIRACSHREAALADIWIRNLRTDRQGRVQPWPSSILDEGAERRRFIAQTRREQRREIVDELSRARREGR